MTVNVPTMPYFSDLRDQNNTRLIGTVGFGARAIVYLIIGLWALLLVLGQGGGLIGTSGALRRVLEQPLGQILLGVLAIGFFAFAIWRVLEGVFDYEKRGSAFGAILFRAGRVLAGLAYLGFGYSAINLIFHFSREDGGDGASPSRLSRFLLEQPAGAYLVGAVALALIGFAVGQVVIAWTERFTRGLELPRNRGWLLPICKIGISARGIAFGIVGWFMLRSAMYFNSREAKGLGGVWRFLAELPFGTILIAAMALGLIAFAVYGFVEATYRCGKRAC